MSPLSKIVSTCWLTLTSYFFKSFLPPLQGFDWQNPEIGITELLNKSIQVDYLFGSDVFYDPCVFEILIKMLRRLFDLFPLMEFYFSYQIRE